MRSIYTVPNAWVWEGGCGWTRNTPPLLVQFQVVVMLRWMSVRNTNQCMCMYVYWVSLRVTVYLTEGKHHFACLHQTLVIGRRILSQFSALWLNLGTVWHLVLWWVAAVAFCDESHPLKSISNLTAWTDLQATHRLTACPYINTKESLPLITVSRVIQPARRPVGRQQHKEIQWH